MIIKAPTPKFIPAEYCDYPHLRRTAYYSLFPEVEDDDEISSAISETLKVFKPKLAEARQKAGLQLQAIPPPSISGVGGSLSRKADRGPRKKETRETQEFQGEIQSAYRVKSEIAKQCFDPTTLISRTQETEEEYQRRLRHAPLQDYFDLPRFLLVIGYERWLRLQETLRNHLYRGSLRVFHVSINGVASFPNNNVWLNDEYANAALKSGKAAPRPIEHPAVECEMLFRRDEVHALFPAHGSEPGAQQDGNTLKGTKLERTVAWLEAEYPEGMPPGTRMKPVKNRAIDTLGISKSTFDTALRQWRSQFGHPS